MEARSRMKVRQEVSGWAGRSGGQEIRKEICVVDVGECSVRKCEVQRRAVLEFERT